MSLFHRLVCCVLSISIALPAGPMAYAAQKSKAPEPKPAPKAPSIKVGKQPNKAQEKEQSAAAAAKGAAPAPAALPKSIDLRHVQRDAFAVIVVHPRAFLEGPGMELVPREIIVAAAMKEAGGIDPTKIDRVTFSVSNFDPPRDPSPAAVFSFSEPVDPQRAFASLKQGAEETSIAGKKVWIDARQRIAIHHPNDRTVIIASSEEVLRNLLAGQAVEDTPFVQRLKQTDFAAQAVVVVGLDGVRNQLDALMAQAPPLFPPFQEFNNIPALTSAMEMRLVIGGSPDFEWIVHARNAEAAVKLERLINQGLAMGKEMIFAQMSQQFQSDDPVEQASAQYFRRIIDHFAGAFKPTRNGDRVAISVDTQSGPAIAAGILVALLLPAIQAARAAARRNSSINNMRQIGLAMLNYHDVYKTFPPRAKLDKDGKPLLSWRVLILPYIEEARLYNEFHLDEPWDSEHNKKLIEHMPPVYQNPNLPPSTKTNYLVPFGDDTIFATEKPVTFRDIKDGTSRTIMVLEVDSDRAVTWTKPDDYDVNPKEPLAGLGTVHAGSVFGATFADGSVRLITKDIDPELFLLLLKKSDGKATQFPPIEGAAR